MCRKNGVYWITFCLAVILVIGSVAPVADFDDNDLQSTLIVSEPERGNVFVAGTPHAPIVIDGDANFTLTASNEGWLGDGSSGNPFVIDGLDIDQGGAAGHCISISNTRVNFTISNCNLTGASVSLGSGIYLYNVQFGRLVNNTCSNNQYGIQIDSSRLTILRNNTCVENIYGIYLNQGSTDNVVIDNNCSFNTNRGISLDNDADYNMVMNNLCIDNLPFGIVLYRSDFNTVANNTYRIGSDDGIHIRQSKFNTIANNTFSNFAYGIRIFDLSLNNTIANNTCTQNFAFGISIDASSYDNTIEWNSFIDNNINAVCNRMQNVIDYNYWSDYTGEDINNDCVGDTPHPIVGSAGNQDPHPLMYPPGVLLQWTQTPANQYISHGAPFRYDLNASSFFGINQWWIDDTVSFQIDQNGIITNATFLALGVYIIHVFVNDTIGDNLEAVISVTASPYVLHNPIVIVSDANFTATAATEGWPGDGSSGNPYVINGLYIDRGGGAGHCISISNTRVNFTISNCNLTGASVSPGSGIYLLNVSYGKLMGNLFEANDRGITIDDGSTLNTVVNNNCTNNYIGFVVRISNTNTVTNNTCGNNFMGIYFDQSHSNTVTNNTCISNTNIGILVSYSNTNDIQWNIFVDSNYNGYRELGSGNIFDYNYWSDYAGTDANEDGFGDTPYTLNYVSDPHPLMFLPTPPIWNETPVDQTIMPGTHFTYDLNATAPAPIFWSVDDTVNFTIDSQGVIESIGFLDQGDYSVQVTVTNIYGDSISARFTVEVFSPDTTAPGWVITPTDLTIEFGEGVDIQIPALDPSGIDHWILNDTSHFALSATYYDLGSTARITNDSVLEPAIYGLNITVYDSYNNRLSAIFTVTVEPPEPDTTSPTWVSLRIYQTIEYGEVLQVQVEVWDESGIDHYWLNDTTHFILDGQGVIRNATVLEPGVYRLEVRAYDPYDNYCSAILVVTVLESQMTTTTTDSTTTGTVPEGINPVLTLVLGTGLGGVAVVVIVIVSLRRKS